MEYPHQPVLVQTVIKYLISDPNGIYVDGTAGSGGHSLAVAEALDEGGRLICLDRDPEAVRLSKLRLASMGERVQIFQESYAELDKVLGRQGLKGVDGVLLDLGMSSFQLDRSGRGFSFSKDEPLDMRMDPGEEVTAAQLVNDLPQRDLERILRKYGEERMAKRISRAIDRERKEAPIRGSAQLANVILSAIPQARRRKSKHPATRTFQALRIAVNHELENLEVFLGKAPLLVKTGGRLVVLSYHSLEDRLVKRAMTDWEARCTCPSDVPYCVCGKTALFRRVLKRGVKPGEKEIEANPRARSAILRVAERTQS